MHRTVSRRDVLRAIGSASVGAALVGRGSARDGAVSGGADRDGTGRTGGFDPSVHGFGFRNWSTSTSTYPEHDHSAVSEDEIRRTVRRDWKDPLDRLLDLDVGEMPDLLIDLVARQLYVAVNQLSATNGHCYGMVFAAQRYYEHPDSIPRGRESASALTSPEKSSGAATTVGADIDRYHNQQFLSVYSWLGRRRAFRPASIDYRAELESLTAAVDEYGTAGITVFNPNNVYSHQVLVYGYDRDPEGVTLRIYDPNVPAPRYAAASRTPTLRVDTAGDRPEVQPYGQYSAFLYNRWDRAILSEGIPDPPPIRRGRRSEIRRGVESLALFLVDSPAVDVVVAGPNGNPVSRFLSSFMDRRRTEYSAARYRYGARPGTYRIAVLARDDAEYALTADAASVDGARLDSRAAASIDCGETHEYVATIPESGVGDLSRVTDGDLGRSIAALGGAAALGGVATYLARRSGRDDE